MGVEDWQATVEALGRPEAHPEDPSAGEGVEAVQTHISFVWLTRDRVYKLRKPVSLGFLEFGSREERNRDCLDEVRLNRRLAPDVYLGVAPVLEPGPRARLGAPAEDLAEDDGSGRPPEHCVVMRRLPGGEDALSRLEAGRLTTAHVDALAGRIARFHAGAGLGSPAPFSPAEWRARITEPVTANFDALDRTPDVVPAERVRRARARAEARFEAAAGLFEARRQEGRAVDGHGDLHLDHVWFEGDSLEPVLIDCIEFSEGLRRVDAASDVAFLAMDLVYRGRADWSERLLRRYARASDDWGLYGVVDYYVAYRAAVRAKVAALAAGEAEIAAAQRRRAAGSARDHLGLALESLAERGAGGLVLVCGLVGVGKSTLAELAADALEAAVVSSDRVRKRLAGLDPTARVSGAEAEQLYGEEATERVYAGLLERAEPVTLSGRPVVLDATFSRARFRDDAVRWAEARDLPWLVVEATCSSAEARRRLASRARAGGDPSDAGPEFYARSAAAFESLEAIPAPARIAIATDAPDWQENAGPALCARWQERSA